MRLQVRNRMFREDYLNVSLYVVIHVHVRMYRRKRIEKNTIHAIKNV